MRGEKVGVLADPIIIPYQFGQVWEWFLSLSSQRQEDKSLSWSDIHSYFKLINYQTCDRDLDVIKNLDAICLNVIHAEKSNEISGF